MRKFMYYLALFLTAADIIALALLGAFAWYTYQNGRMDDRVIPIFVVAAAILVIAYPILDVFRRKSRVASKYDKFGRMTQNASYEKMSVKQQKELDKQRLINEERILPMTMVRELTHNGSKNPEEDLASLTGLASVKEKVEEMEARMEYERAEQKKNKNKNKTSEHSKHMVFFGPPGTGKTTVAKIMTSYLYKYGYIEENKLMIVNGSFFSGAAAEKTEAIVRRAFGKVLFIDEAYSLLDCPESAIATLIAQMEDNRDKFVLILAGYENEMRMLLKSNPGFLSRISEFLYFEDYSDEEMLMIFRNMAEKEGFTITAAGERKFIECVNVARNEDSFGNARTCRNILDKSISKHSLHVKQGLARKTVLDENDIVLEENPLARR